MGEVLVLVLLGLGGCTEPGFRGGKEGESEGEEEEVEGGTHGDGKGGEKIGRGGGVWRARIGKGDK